jgi:hypothetical protein
VKTKNIVKKNDKEIEQSQERKEIYKQLVKQSHKIQNARRRKIYQEIQERKHAKVSRD